MRKLIAALGSVAIGAVMLLGAEEKASEKIVFETKQGNVTFLHQKHAERQKTGCKACHDSLWPQKKGAPLNFKAGMHKVAEQKHTSCGFCHHEGGAAFQTKGNCAKCHVKAAGAAKNGD